MSKFYRCCMVLSYFIFTLFILSYIPLAILSSIVVEKYKQESEQKDHQDYTESAVYIGRLFVGIFISLALELSACFGLACVYFLNINRDGIIAEIRNGSQIAECSIYAVLFSVPLAPLSGFLAKHTIFSKWFYEHFSGTKEFITCCVIFAIGTIFSFPAIFISIRCVVFMISTIIMSSYKLFMEFCILTLTEKIFFTFSTLIFCLFLTSCVYAGIASSQFETLCGLSNDGLEALFALSLITIALYLIGVFFCLRDFLFLQKKKQIKTNIYDMHKYLTIMAITFGVVGAYIFAIYKFATLTVFSNCFTDEYSETIIYYVCSSLLIMSAIISLKLIIFTCVIVSKVINTTYKFIVADDSQ